MTQTIVQLVSRWHKTLYNSLSRWHSFVQHADFLTILLNSPTHWHKPLYNSPKHWHKILYNSPSRWHNFVKHTNILTILYNLSNNDTKHCTTRSHTDTALYNTPSRWHKTLYNLPSRWYKTQTVARTQFLATRRSFDNFVQHAFVLNHHRIYITYKNCQ